MKHIGKRILAVLLCLALLAGVPVALSVSADEMAQARTALLDAWAQLKQEVVKVVAYPRNTTPIEELPDSLGLTAEQKAQMGDCYLKVTGTGQSSGWESPYNHKTLAGFHKVTYSVYAAATGSVMENVLFRKDTEAALIFPGSYSSLNVGFSTFDITEKLSPLINDGVAFNGCKYHVYQGTGDVYIGAVIGYTYEAVALPENANELMAHELLNAAEQVDLSGVQDGPAKVAFEEAKVALLQRLELDGAALIEAWSQLETEVGTTITYPTGYTEKPIAELKANLPADLSADQKITDEQLAKMGSHYFTMSHGDSDLVTWNHVNKLSVLEGYDKITWSVYSPVFAGFVRMYIGNQLIDQNVTVREGNVGQTQGSATFLEIDCTAALNGAKINGMRVEVADKYSAGTGPIYFGSVMGWKAEKLPLPENVYNMNEGELLLEALKVDLETVVDSEAKNTFATARALLLEKIKAEESALIEAWNGLKAEEAVVIAYPRNTTPIAEFPTNLGLTAAEIAGFGDCFLKVSGTGKSAGWDSPYKYQSLTEFHKITTSVYTTAAGSTLENALERADGGGNLYYARSWSALSAGLTVLDSTSNFAALLDGTTSFNTCTYHVYEGTGDVYVGATLGWKYVAEKAPENAIFMTAEELLGEALKVNVDACLDGADKEAFLAARAALYAKVKPEEAALIEAWSNLKKEVATTITYPTGYTEKPISELKNNLPADLPADKMITDEQLAKMGSHYFTMSHGDANLVTWNHVNKLSVLEGYDKITWSVYSPVFIGYVRMYIGNQLIDQNVTIRQGNVGQTQGSATFLEIDCTEALNGAKINGMRVEVVDKYSAGTGPIYFGSVVGYKTQTVTLPDNVYAMSLEELLKAANAVDPAEYEDTDAFVAARKAVQEKLDAIDPEEIAAQNLIAAWQVLTTQSKISAEVLAIPKNGAVAVTDETVVNGLSDVSVLGSHYQEPVAVTPGWTAIQFSGVKANVNPSYYTDIYFYAIGLNGDGTAVSTQWYPQISWSVGTENLSEATGWTKVPFMRPDKENAFFGFYCLKGAAQISYGSVIGEYLYTPTLPENYSTLSVTELVRAAKQVDYEGLVGADAFEAALAAAEVYADQAPELREKLLEEWRALKKTYTEEVASAGAHGSAQPVEVTEATAFAGLNNTAVLGSHYVEIPVEGIGWDHQYFYKVYEETKKFSKYDFVEGYYAVRDENGNYISGAGCIQVNGAVDFSNEATGWTKVRISTSIAASNVKFVLVRAGGTPKTLILGSLIGTYSERPAIPENVDDMDFLTLVEAASACDVSNFEATEFLAALQDCRDLIAARRERVMTAWQALGTEIPADADSLTVSELVKAALEQDLSAASHTKEFGLAVWSFHMLTTDGQLFEALRSAWKAFAELPEKDRLQTPVEWVEAADALDTSAATSEQKAAFETALAAVRDLLTKGKADATALQKLVDDANTMREIDFTIASWAPFGTALQAAEDTLDNYSQVTQNQMDAAADALLEAWGGLRMYVRTHWADMMSYFLKEEPGMSLGGRGEGITVVAVQDPVPNGTQNAMRIMNQTSGWGSIAAVGGVNLENLSKYEFIEVWFKADPTESISELLWQFNRRGGGQTYTADYPLPEGAKCGEWYRLEIPVYSFRDDLTYTTTLAEDTEYQAGTLQFMHRSAESSYALSDLVAVYTEPVTAGVVPEVPEMAVRVREPIPEPVPPKNPFTGVDRKDPWGESMKDQLVKDEESSEGTSEETPEAEALYSGTCGKDLTWKLTENGELIISGTGAMDDYDDKTPWDAYLDKIVTVTVKDGVTSIGNSAFYGCRNLVQVKLPQTLTSIGEYACYDCDSLTFAVIPDSVTAIGDYAFGYVYDEDAGTAVAVEDFGLYGTQGSVAEDYANAYELAFYAIAPDPNATEDDGADEDWGTPDDSTEEDPTEEGDGTEETPEAQIVDSGSCGENLTWTFYDNGTLIISGTGDMDDYTDLAPWIAAGHDVLAVVIEEGVTGIGDSAFYGCVNLAELSVPATVTRVGAFAFYECESLTEIKVSAAVTSVGPYAFGYVYDAAAGDAALLPGFKLLVADPSAALIYAQNYEVPYEIYETLSSDTPNDGQTDTTPATTGLDWWVWLLIVLGGVIVLGGGATVIVVAVKRKQNKGNTEVSA